MARNWLTAFRPASFRGVPFKVDLEAVEGARRLSISPIAYAETSVIEDMGREPRRMRLAAYCAGEVADIEATTLAAALSARGPALLMLPMMGAISARVQAWGLRREKDVAGHVGFDIDFVEAGMGAFPAGIAGAGAFGDMMRVGAALFAEAFG